MTRASDLARLIGAGATINDGTTITTADNNPQLTLISTDADENVGPEVDLYRNSASPADGDIVGRLVFNGENDADEKIDYANIQFRIADASDGTEDAKLLIVKKTAGADVSVMASDATETVFNDGSIDLDFRVESNGNANMLVVDGGNDKIGVGTSSPADLFTVAFNDSSIINGITLQGTNTGGYGGYLGWKDSWSGDSYDGYRAAILGDVPSANDGRLGFHVAKGGSLTQSVKIDTDRQIIHTCDAGGVFSIHTTNDGNNSNRYGILVQSGADDASGTNYSMQFRDGDGTTQGQITFSGGTVSYGTFTAYHPCVIPDSDNDKDSLDNAYPYGTLLEIKSVSYTQKNEKDTERGIVYNVQKSSSAKSKAVLGAYGSSMNGSPINDKENETNKHQALVLGDGHILCNNENGNIEIGDYICTSSTSGEGMKATSICTAIGVAREAVTFSNSTAKLVAVEYGYKQFIPEDLEARITALEKG